ncbi:MAG: hypothetical protein IPO27_05260 [Bacteroidetes bacterium]|nr:hypothetical protein [Bacteroidota bacterium]
MNKIKYKLLALLLLAVFSGWSKDFSLKKIDTEYSRSLEKYFNKYTVCEIPLTEISNYVNQCSAKINFGLELSDRKFALQLELNDMRGKSFKAIAMTDHGPEEIPQAIANTYKGITDDKAGNIVRLTIDENTFEGYIIQNGQQFYCEPLKNFNPNAPANLFVIYDAADVKPNNTYGCAADEVKQEKQRWDNKKDVLNKMQTGNCYFAEIATEADYEYYQTFASAAVTLNRIRTILNQVEGLYISRGFT